MKNVQALVLLFLLAACTQSNQSTQLLAPIPVGTVFGGSNRFIRSDVPLPPGQWKLATYGERYTEISEAGMPERVIYASLVQTHRNQLAGIVMLTGTRAGEFVLRKPDLNCRGSRYLYWGGNRPLYESSGRGYSEVDARCIRVSALQRTWKDADSANIEDRELYAYLQSTDTSRYAVSLSTTVEAARKGELVSVRYEIFPQIFGGPRAAAYSGTDLEWAPQYQARNRQHKAFLDKWIEWSKPMAVAVGSGLGNTLKDYRPQPYPFAAQ